MRIGIDLMGSDNSPLVLFEAVLQAAQKLKASSSLTVLATPDFISHMKQALHAAALPSPSAAIKFQSVDEIITMSDEPLTAIRRKKNSSLVQGIKLLKKKSLDAFVSTGNTGALIASASLSLPMLPGIKRPALLAVLPTKIGSVAVLDVGGNVAVKAQYLVQFAQMGAAYQRAAQSLAVPKVGLLNIGVESKKGTSEVRQAYQQLSTNSKEGMSFLGNVEGREVFEGKVDVLVTDGFSGNVFLKTTEGLAAFIFSQLHDHHRKNPTEGLEHWLKGIQQQFKYDEYPGAILCGIDGLVMKCHGHSSPRAIYNGIMGAALLIERGLVGAIKQELLKDDGQNGLNGQYGQYGQYGQ